MGDSTQLEPTPVLTPEELCDLDQIGTVFQFGDKSLLVKDGDYEDDSALLIISGHVRVVKGPQQEVAAVRGPGELIGEMACVTGRPRTASIYAIGEVTARILPSGQWRQFLFDHPRAMFAQLYVTAQRLEEATAKGAEKALESERKVAKALMDLYTSGLGKEVDEGVRFSRISQAGLGHMAGLSRESVAHTIKQFKQAKIVVTGREQVTVLDMAALREIAEGTATAAQR